MKLNIKLDGKMKLYGNWDMQDRFQHYARFKFTVQLPKLRKAREITKRDGCGRIVRSIAL